MTITEKKQPSFGVNDEVYILDTQIYDTPKWIHGVVEEVGDESILVKWDDLEDPTEYQISDMPDIRHREPTPEGEKVEDEKITKLKSIVQDMVNNGGDDDLLAVLQHIDNLLTNDNTQTK